MSGYPQQGAQAQAQDGYGQQPQGQPQDYDGSQSYDATSPPGVAPGPQPGPAPGRKKRRDYAGQAYEFGAGGNAAATPLGQGGTPVTGYSAQQDAAGYAQGGYAQNPTAVQQGQTPMYGGQDLGAVGGYQPPGPQYPTQPQSQPQQQQPGVPGMTQQFSQMDMSQKPMAQQPQAQQGRAPVLNQLYPTDLQNQPLNVAELDYPPPPAILPPNVSITHDLLLQMLTPGRRV